MVSSVIHVLCVATDNKDGDAQKSTTTAADTFAPQLSAPRDPVLNFSSWKTADVHNWLENNNIKHLQRWYLLDSVENNCHL